MDGQPAGTLNITTDALPNGTIATTTTTTDADGTTTTSVKLVDPFNTTSNAAAAAAPVAAPPVAAAPAPGPGDAPSASAVAAGAAGDILGGVPPAPATPTPPPPASPDSPVYEYASAVDAIMGGSFRSRRRALLEAAHGGLRMGFRGGPAPGQPGACPSDCMLVPMAPHGRPSACMVLVSIHAWPCWGRYNGAGIAIWLTPTARAYMDTLCALRRIRALQMLMSLGQSSGQRPVMSAHAMLPKSVWI